MARSFQGIQLGSIEVFLTAAEALSFTTAAAMLGLTAPAVSRSIARLEARLGVRLFARTTRQVTLTDDGRLYFEQCREALRQIADAEDVLGGRRTMPSGHLRISVPTTYAHHRLLPLLPEFKRLHPMVTLEINVANRNIDFVDEGFDLAIRLGTPADNRLVARKLEDATLGLFAAPAYLKANRAPRSIDDLQRHTLIGFERPSTGRPMPWLFRDRRAVREYAPRGDVSCSDDVLGCVSYARAGGGLFQIYHFVAAEDVRRGDLVEVLKAHAGASRPFSVLYPQNRHQSAKVRVMVDYLVDRLG
jgi:DNA-binding transcriptional LysR family regulator